MYVNSSISFQILHFQAFDPRMLEFPALQRNEHTSQVIQLTPEILLDTYNMEFGCILNEENRFQQTPDFSEIWRVQKNEARFLRVLSSKSRISCPPKGSQCFPMHSKSFLRYSADSRDTFRYLQHEIWMHIERGKSLLANAM